MAKEPFIQPKFEGRRFEEHTLPVSAAKDLAAYEELVIEVARHLYRVNHENRVRVPKGFAKGFHLHLERIEPGSAKPLLSLVIGAALFSDLPQEINEAKDLINKVIATAERDPLPNEFPKELYSYFNRIGRSLEEGEEIQWTPESPKNKSALTPSKRKRLVLANQETYHAEVDIVGVVEEINSRTKTGILRTPKNDAVTFSFDDPFLADLKEVLGVKFIYAHIEGVGVFDVNDRLSSILEIEQLETLPHYQLVSAIDELSGLENGWLEGGGIAPQIEDLEWLTGEVVKAFPDDLEHPSAIPTEEGNISFEWVRPKARVELEINFTEEKLELYATDLGTGAFVESEFRKGEWDAAFGKVKELLLT